MRLLDVETSKTYRERGLAAPLSVLHEMRKHKETCVALRELFGAHLLSSDTHVR